MSFTLDVPSTKEVLAAILDTPLSNLPPAEAHYGATKVSWWEVDPGKVYIETRGGGSDDRYYASILTATQLESHGFTRARFDMDKGCWDDIDDPVRIHALPQSEAALHTSGWP